MNTAEQQNSDGSPGPIETRVRTLLSDRVGDTWHASVAERSPLGPRAVKLRPRDERAATHGGGSALSAWLEAQDWVDAVALRPPNVYVRIRAMALRSWVLECLPAAEVRADTTADPAASFVLRFGGVDRRTLHGFREYTVGRALASVLQARGYQVSMEMASEPTRAVRVDPAGLVVPVGEVDLVHGPLRARLGGAVGVDDLLEEIRSGIERRTSVRSETSRVAGALAFLLLRTERSRRIQLDEARLWQEVDAFEALLAVQTLALSGGEGVAGRALRDEEAPVRELVAELDSLPRLIVRAATQAEPAWISRHARALTSRVRAAAPYLVPGDAIWPAVARAIGACIRTLALDMTDR